MFELFYLLLIFPITAIGIIFCAYYDIQTYKWEREKDA